MGSIPLPYFAPRKFHDSAFLIINLHVVSSCPRLKFAVYLNQLFAAADQQNQVVSIETVPVPTFLQYLYDGLSINGK